MNTPNLEACDYFEQLGENFFSYVEPTPLKNPHWIHINPDVANQIAWNEAELRTHGLAIFNGEQSLLNQRPKAMVYAGHQFGGYSPQLGDGRALLIAQLKTKEGLLDLQLKGAGKTPYSRFGDGRAVLRSSIREYLAGEAMHALGIATTRALCLLGSHEPVHRETIETGAIVARTAKTHIRFGHFEYFHYQQRWDELKTLVDYVAQHFIPQDLLNRHNNPCEAMLMHAVTETAKMVARWQAVGFAHGVMNTDNMSIIGDTLDYGPYGFLDDYEPGFICNHSDTTGRYAFDQQPGVALWNLNALGHALSSQLSLDTIKSCLQSYETNLNQEFSQQIRKKLGLELNREEDSLLSRELFILMSEDKVDYHHFFRSLCEFSQQGTHHKVSQLFQQKRKIDQWCALYRQRLQQEPQSEDQRQLSMARVNPKFTARNYLLQKAIEMAAAGDFSEIATLFKLLQAPYDEHLGYESYAEPPPESGKHLAISCSS